MCAPFLFLNLGSGEALVAVKTTNTSIIISYDLQLHPYEVKQVRVTITLGDWEDIEEFYKTQLNSYTFYDLTPNQEYQVVADVWDTNGVTTIYNKTSITKDSDVAITIVDPKKTTVSPGRPGLQGVEILWALNSLPVFLSFPISVFVGPKEKTIIIRTFWASILQHQF